MKQTDINMNTNKYKHKENNYRINKQAKYVAGYSYVKINTNYL